MGSRCEAPLTRGVWNLLLPLPFSPSISSPISFPIPFPINLFPAGEREKDIRGGTERSDVPTSFSLQPHTFKRHRIILRFKENPPKVSHTLAMPDPKELIPCTLCKAIVRRSIMKAHQKRNTCLANRKMIPTGKNRVTCLCGHRRCSRYDLSANTAYSHIIYGNAYWAKQEARHMNE